MTVEQVYELPLPAIFECDDALEHDQYASRGFLALNQEQDQENEQEETDKLFDIRAR